MSSESDTILLIEDSQSTRLAYKKIFTDAGYDVKEAETGEEGWDKAISLSPDLIVLDLILPDIHGLEVLKKVRSHVKTKEIPVLVLTDIKEAEEIQKTMNLGASHYAHKGSITPEKILHIAHDLINKPDSNPA